MNQCHELCPRITQGYLVQTLPKNRPSRQMSYLSTFGSVVLTRIESTFRIHRICWKTEGFQNWALSEERPILTKTGYTY